MMRLLRALDTPGWSYLPPARSLSSAWLNSMSCCHLKSEFHSHAISEGPMVVDGGKHESVV